MESKDLMALGFIFVGLLLITGVILTFSMNNLYEKGQNLETQKQRTIFLCLIILFMFTICLGSYSIIKGFLIMQGDFTYLSEEAK